MNKYPLSKAMKNALNKITVGTWTSKVLVLFNIIILQWISIGGPRNLGVPPVQFRGSANLHFRAGFKSMHRGCYRFSGMFH